jgi:hypothetical protein
LCCPCCDEDSKRHERNLILFVDLHVDVTDQESLVLPLYMVSEENDLCFVTVLDLVNTWLWHQQHRRLPFHAVSVVSLVADSFNWPRTQHTLTQHMCRLVMEASARIAPVVQMFCVYLLLLASIVVGSVANAASITGSMQEQPNAVCSFVSNTSLSLQHLQQSRCASTVKCLTNELGWPTTDGEM